MNRFDLVGMLLSIPGIIIGLTFHEFAHAFVADRLGDPTPRNQGRLTISPLSHIDPVGFLFLLLFNFGWAKPVQVNHRYFKNPRRDDILVSAAGPVTNLILAFLFAVALKFMFVAPVTTGKLYFNLQTIILKAIVINCILFILNILPVPPLDGFHVLSGFLPYRFRNFIFALEKYGTLILILLIITPAANYIIGLPAGMIYNLIFRILNM